MFATVPYFVSPVAGRGWSCPAFSNLCSTCSTKRCSSSGDAACSATFCSDSNNFRSLGFPVEVSGDSPRQFLKRHHGQSPPRRMKNGPISKTATTIEGVAGLPIPPRTSAINGSIGLAFGASEINWRSERIPSKKAIHCSLKNTLGSIFESNDRLFRWRMSLFGGKITNAVYGLSCGILQLIHQLGGTLHHRIIIRGTGGAFRLPLNQQGEAS
jgi:hypothetical protein